MQIEEKQLCSASPIEPQTSEKLHSTEHEQTYNAIIVILSITSNKVVTWHKPIPTVTYPIYFKLQ